MNRNYISPEFEYKQVFGTLKMTEDVSFFSSKMLEIEDSLNVLSDNLIYYQLDTNEQLDEDTEKSLPEIIYDATVDKKSNHTIMLDLNQTAQQKLDKARWIIEIDLKKILRNYIFALLKKNRTFNGVRNTMVISNNVNTSITESALVQLSRISLTSVAVTRAIYFLLSYLCNNLSIVGIMLSFHFKPHHSMVSYIC